MCHNVIFVCFIVNFREVERFVLFFIETKNCVYVNETLKKDRVWYSVQTILQVYIYNIWDIKIKQQKYRFDEIMYNTLSENE